MTQTTEAVGTRLPGTVGPVPTPAAGRAAGAPRLPAVAALLAPVGLVALWWLLGVTAFAGRHVVATPYGAVRQMIADGFYLHDVGATLATAALGWLIGNAVALVAATACLFAPRLEGLLLRVAAATYAVPTIAVGPLLLILVSPATTRVVMSAMPVVFTSLVGMLLGLRSASPVSLDLVHALGGGRWAALTKVRLRAAVPATFSGLALAVPAAVLGAIIADYLGNDEGLGVLMLQAQASLKTDRLWAVGLVATVVSGGLFWLTDRLGRLLTAASASAPVDLASGLTPAGGATRGALAVAARRLASLVVTLVVVLALWWAAVALSGLDAYFARTPLSLLRSLHDPAGTSTGTVGGILAHALARTLRDALVGFGIGVAAAVVFACGTAASRLVEAAVMPVVLVLRVVPLVAMAPLFGLVLGRGTVGVATLTAIIVFVPSMVSLSQAMRDVHPSLVDAFRVSDASTLSVVTRLRLPHALPALLAAVRVALPGALLGAVVAEWLLTDYGLGHVMAVAVIESSFSLLWGAVVLATFVAIVLYNAASVAEQLINRRVRG